MPQPPKVVRLEDLPVIPGPGTLTWRPVRRSLGIRAFGCNAYTASDAGQDVIEPHSESLELAHEELYFVAAGRATFTIDGERYDAPAGTYVFLPDPASFRHGVAEEPGTTVLSFGGPPTFVPSAWEWGFEAAALFHSDPARAREILQDGLRIHPESASTHYNLACLEAIEGNRDAALAALARAIELHRETAGWARDDDDFASLREDPAFRELVGG